MTNKKKNTLIIFLLAVTVGLIISLVSVIYINDNQTDPSAIQDYREQISLLNQQLQEERAVPDNNRIIIENVCTNFLETYYTVQHSTSLSASAEKCKPYCTPELFSRIAPGEAGKEYSDKEIDIDYSSNIVIHNTYYCLANPEKVIVNCTINKNVNGMKSVNNYFVELNVSDTANEWLVDRFELISVQGDK